MSTSNMTTYDESMEMHDPNGFLDDSTAGGSHPDLDQFFNFSQHDGMHSFHENGMLDMYNLGSMFVSGNAMDDSLMQSALSGHDFQQASQASQTQMNFGYPAGVNMPLPQQIDPASIMADDRRTSASSSGKMQSQLHAGSKAGSSAKVQAPEQSESQPETAQAEVPPPPKPKRTRQSKKKKLSQEEQDKKRKEFLERNRQAASKCRSRKQEATAKLQQRAQNLNLANAQMRETVDNLQLEIMQMAKMLLNHADSCSDNPMFQEAVAHYRLKIESGIFLDAGSGGGMGGVSSDSMSPAFLDSLPGQLGDENLQHRTDTSCASTVAGDDRRPSIISHNDDDDVGEDELDIRGWAKPGPEVTVVAITSDSSGTPSTSSRSPPDESIASPGYLSAVTSPNWSSKEVASPQNETDLAALDGMANCEDGNIDTPMLFESSNSLPGSLLHKSARQQQRQQQQSMVT